MPGGQYFYTNPNTAAIASNLSKIFFGDPEAQQQQLERDQLTAQTQGLGLKNRLAQQQLDDQQSLHADRGMLGNLFGGMRSPEDFKLQAPAIAAILARTAGLPDAATPEQIAQTQRYSAANQGLGDETVFNSVVGAGQTPGVNDAVSLAGQDRIRNLNQQNDMSKVGAQEAGANSRTAATIAGENYRQMHPGKVNVPIGDSVYLLDENNAPVHTFTSDPAAIAADRATKTDVTRAGKPPKISPAESAEIRKQVVLSLPPKQDNAENSGIINALVERASAYVLAGHTPQNAIINAQTDLLQTNKQGGPMLPADTSLLGDLISSLTGPYPEHMALRSDPNAAPPIPTAPPAEITGATSLTGPPAAPVMPGSATAYPTDTGPVGEVFNPTDASTQAADTNGMPLPPQMQQQPGMAPGGKVPEGTRRTYRGKDPAMQGVVQIYQNGQWVTQNARTQ